MQRTKAAAPGSTPSSAPAPSAELVARAADGDAEAFSQIYSICAPGVRRYVRTIIWDAWDADDVTQEVFVKIFTALPQYDPERAAFSAWMLRVARNAAIDHLRHRRAWPTDDPVDEHAQADDTGQRCAESLREALVGLTQSQREFLVLRALGGFTPPEVAHRVRRTRGSINTLYHRARLAAKDNLVAMDAAPSTYSVPIGGRESTAEALPAAGAMVPA
jgi:RNA polymerase sigma-70 factor (ECF subfamily)